RNQNHLLKYAPQMEEPFSDAMVAALALVEPRQVVDGMKEATSGSPPPGAEPLEGNALLLTERSLLLLKKGAAAKLPRADIFDLLILKGAQLFCANDSRAAEQVADRLVGEAAQDRQARRELAAADLPEPLIYKELEELGYFFSRKSATA